MNITEFAQSRNKTVGAISNYIQRHRELFKGHTKKTGNNAELDDYALEILEKKYPLPKPIEIIEDKESREKLIKAQAQIIELQEQWSQAQTLIAKAEVTKLLLEDKEAQLDKAEKETQDLKAKNENLSAELEKLRIENATLKSRGLIARIFNKI